MPGATEEEEEKEKSLCQSVGRGRGPIRSGPECFSFFLFLKRGLALFPVASVQLAVAATDEVCAAAANVHGDGEEDGLLGGAGGAGAAAEPAAEAAAAAAVCGRVAHTAYAQLKGEKSK